MSSVWDPEPEERQSGNRYATLLRMWQKKRSRGEVCEIELCFGWPIFGGACSTHRHVVVVRPRFR
jgi:hypothetical protein